MISPEESRGFAYTDATAASPDSASGGGEASFHSYDAPAPTPGFEQFAANSPPRYSTAPQPTVLERNRTTLTALAVVVGYLVLAKTTGIVLLGIFPVMLSIRAFQRKEQLAPLALLAAAVAVVFSLSVMAHH
jgi:hypothetical protein